MEMTIEESMKVLQEVPKVMPITKESINVAIDTMQKYQKIEEIMKKEYRVADMSQCLVERLVEIREVVEDGNDD